MNGSIRGHPIKLYCPATKLRIVNKVIYEEYASNNEKDNKKWAIKASERLKKHNIKISPSTLSQYKNKIILGKRDPICATSFGNEIDNDKCGSRYGKDEMYAKFELYQDLFLLGGVKNYVGLPANQIVKISKAYNSVVACETNQKMYEFMTKVHSLLSEKDNVDIKNENIFSYLGNTSKKFSVFDFDLMCNIDSKGLIDNIAESIYNTSEQVAVVNVATSYGRKITEKKYESMMPHMLINKLVSKGLAVPHFYSGKYNDRIIPIKYLMFVVRRMENRELT